MADLPDLSWQFYRGRRPNTLYGQLIYPVLVRAMVDLTGKLVVSPRGEASTKPIAISMPDGNDSLGSWKIERSAMLYPTLRNTSAITRIEAR